MKSRISVLIAMLVICVAAFGAGAPWYKWKNKVDRTVVCAQISPGEAWFQYQGPFMESQCRKPGNPQ